MENTTKLAPAAKPAKAAYARPELKTFGSVQKLTGWPMPWGKHHGGDQGHGTSGSSMNFDH